MKGLERQEPGGKERAQGDAALHCLHTWPVQELASAHAKAGDVALGACPGKGRSVRVCPGKAACGCLSGQAAMAVWGMLLLAYLLPGDLVAAIKRLSQGRVGKIHITKA